MNTKQKKPSITFTPYEIFVIAIIAFIQFTVILDFMVLSPLGAFLMPIMKINTSQFGLVVSAYAISAGISGILSAGFADKFDRKKMLLFFYTGFVVGTLLCGLANTYPMLLAARIFTGIFGGVIGSIGMAIIADIFKMEARGRVMGFVQMAFSASQVLGIPVGIYLAEKIDWHWTFLMIVIVSTVVGSVMFFKLKPIDAHLKLKNDKNAWLHLWHTASNPYYLRGFLATVLLATGGWMIMPFSSAFLVNNIHIPKANLTTLFLITGVFSLITGPIVGLLSDKLGKFNLFLGGSILSVIMIVIYTNLGESSMTTVVAINSIMWVGISSRIISSSALISGVPEMKDRGAYMGVNSSLQQISGGFAAFISGLIVHQANETAPLENFNIVGYVTIGSMAFTIVMMYIINKMVAKKLHMQTV